MWLRTGGQKWKKKIIYIYKCMCSFKYQGSLFTDNEKVDGRYEKRTKNAKVVTYQPLLLLRHQSNSFYTKIQMKKSIFIPTLFYKCQTWVLNKNQERYRPATFKVVNKTRQDKIRNMDILNTINIPPCIEYTEQHRLKWFGHLIRIQQHLPAA
jgi:hypothetical protein